MDVGYYAPAARTTLDRVFLCARLRARSAQSPSTSPSTPSLGIGGCVPPPGCGYPRNPTTFGAVRGEEQALAGSSGFWGPCSSSATTDKKMKRGMVAPTPHVTTLWHQRPRCDGAQQRRLLCVATAMPQSRHCGARGRRLLRAAPRHPSVGSRFSLKQRPCFLSGGMTSAQGFLSTWSPEPPAIPEEVGRVVLPSPAPEIRLSVARCCCRQGPAARSGGPWR